MGWRVGRMLLMDEQRATVRRFARRAILRGGAAVVLASATGMLASVAQGKSRMEVVVHLQPDIANAFRSGGDSVPRGRIDAVLGRFGSKLTPMYPGSTDPDLATWFVAQDVAEDQARSLADALRALPGVLAAYPQPRPEPA